MGLFMILQKIVPALLLVGGLLGVVWGGQAAALGDAATYTVQPGDTFSTIAARHYGDSGVWRAVWKANPQIRSPSGLSVGDVLNLPASGDLNIPRSYRGRDGLQVVKLSPEVISVPLSEEVFTIPRDAIKPFLDRPRVFDEETAADSPYVVGQYGGRIIAGNADKVYVNGLPEGDNKLFGIYRQGGAFYDIKAGTGDAWDAYGLVADGYATRFNPGSVTDVGREDVLAYQGYRQGLAYLPKEKSEEQLLAEDSGSILGRSVLGYEAVLVAVAELKHFDPDGYSKLKIRKVHMEVFNGDIVLPLETGVFNPDFTPKVPGKAMIGAVIKIPLSYTQAGQFDLVYVSIGTNKGAEPGDLMDVFGVPTDSYDPKTGYNVSLPRERVAQLMILRTYKRMSFAIVLEAARAVRVADNVESSDSI
jgi:LysM repeat protein